MSLDRVREVRAAKRKDLAASLPAFTSPWAGACTRLMQIQMAVLFFYSAIDKIEGDDWWNGDAIWNVFTTDDYYNGMLLDVLASQYWLVNVATYGTHPDRDRLSVPDLAAAPRGLICLPAAIFLHLQFALLMGLLLFLLRHDHGAHELRAPRVADPPRRGVEAKNGRHGDDLRRHAAASASGRWRGFWPSTASGRSRSATSAPILLRSSATSKMEKALYLVLPDGRALPGFEAYRYVVLRVPGLWWQVPFFYVPVLSRLFGHPIYNWIAANRSRL